MFAQHFSSLDLVFLERLMVLAWLATNLIFAIPKCLTHVEIYNDVSVKHNKTLLCLLLYWGNMFRFL